MFFFRKSNPGLQSIYIMQTLFGFAYALIGIFIPIYFLNLGYKLSDVIWYFIFHNLSLLFFSLVAGYISPHAGLKNLLVYRLPFLVLYFYLLYNLSVQTSSLWFLAALDGLCAAMYYVPVNVLFGKHSEEAGLGDAIGKLMALPQIAGIFAPFLGGIIILFYGFKVLFAFTFILIMFASANLVFSRGIKDDFKFSLKDGWNFFRKRPQFIFSEIFDNIGGETEGLIWPVFVYLNLLNVAAVGILGTFVALGGAIFTLAIGNFSDRFDKRKLMKVGSVALLFIWITRFFTHSEITLYATTLLSGFILPLVVLPYTSTTYTAAKKSGNDSFFIFKEVPTVIGRLALFAIALLLVTNIKFIFPIAGVAYLYFLFI